MINLGYVALGLGSEIRQEAITSHRIGLAPMLNSRPIRSGAQCAHNQRSGRIS